MKHILCLIDGLGLGGAQRQLIGLAALLQEKGYNVDLTSYHPEALYYIDLVNKLGINHILLNPTNNKLSKFTLVRKLIRQNKYDVVISFMPSANVISCLTKISGSKHKVIVSDRNTKITKTIKDRIVYGVMYRFADSIIPNSYSQAEYHYNNFPKNSKKVHVITNFTDTNHFAPSDKNISGDKKFTILTAGRIATEKNIIAYLHAIKVIKDEGMDIQFKWFGDPSFGMKNYHREVVNCINRLNINDVISLHPATSDIVKEYQSCEIFCLPSLKEGYPNVICEAMACGKPVICSNICDNPHIVKDGDNGYLFDPKNVEDIANTIRKIYLLSPQERQRMGEKSRKLAVEQFSQEAFVSKYINLIENL